MNFRSVPRSQFNSIVAQNQGVPGDIYLVNDTHEWFICEGLPGGPVGFLDFAAILNGTYQPGPSPNFASVAVNTAGYNIVVPAVPGKRILLLSCILTVSDDVNLKWQHNQGTPKDLTGLAYVSKQGGHVRPFSPVGWFQTDPTQPLLLNLSANVAVGGDLVYGLV